MTEAGFVEDIVCTSDPRTGHNSGCPPQVDDWNKSAANVKRTLRIFNRFYLRFVQEEDKRCKKPKNGNASDDSLRRCSKRPDLKAISEASNWLMHVHILHVVESFQPWSLKNYGLANQ
ncbi:hypothetical protein I3842_05G099500 [Carya illinoinensis]|uniref:Uncharacterized protein n=1 Tax=Carya illinoinensis TaxID=32201 RepID=A0A922F142_CARIL|nr:hypothetical protein I3842_05G099500 [Carya illinoinensis]